MTLDPFIEAIAERILTDQEFAFGNYGPGRYGWLTDKRVQLEQPIPCRGAQGLWDVSTEIEERLMNLWRKAA